MSRRVHALAVTAFLAASLDAQTPGAHADVIIVPPSTPTPTYTLQPLNYNIEDSVPVALGGALCDRGQCVNIRHPAALGDASIQAGADNLNATLTGDAYTSVIVAGQSQGAQSVTRWMEQYAAALPAGEEVTFVLIANPSRKTGFQSQNGFTEPTPEDSGFTVIDIAREYDGWADWPDHFNILAITNATMGMFDTHITYEDVTNAPTTVDEIERAALDDPDAEQNLVWKSGGTYYVLNRTEILPIAKPLTWIGLNTAAQELSNALRPTIDAAYDRSEQGAGILSTEDSVDSTPASSESVSATSALRNTDASPVTAPDSDSDAEPASKQSERESAREAKQSERESAREAKQSEREAKQSEREAKQSDSGE